MLAWWKPSFTPRIDRLVGGDGTVASTQAGPLFSALLGEQNASPEGRFALFPFHSTEWKLYINGKQFEHFLLTCPDPWLCDVTELDRLHGLAWIEATGLCNEAFEGQRYWRLMFHCLL